MMRAAKITEIQKHRHHYLRRELLYDLQSCESGCWCDFDARTEYSIVFINQVLRWFNFCHDCVLVKLYITCIVDLCDLAWIDVVSLA
jgi:hypothetical protein